MGRPLSYRSLSIKDPPSLSLLLSLSSRNVFVFSQILGCLLANRTSVTRSTRPRASLEFRPLVPGPGAPRSRTCPRVPLHLMGSVCMLLFFVVCSGYVFVENRVRNVKTWYQTTNALMSTFEFMFLWFSVFVLHSQSKFLLHWQSKFPPCGVSRNIHNFSYPFFFLSKKTHYLYAQPQWPYDKPPRIQADVQYLSYPRTC